MAKITMTVVVEQLADGRVAVGVETPPFDQRAVPDQVGALWVGINMAVTQYLNDNGFPGFDSLKQHRRS